jgi:hypothetical protein
MLLTGVAEGSFIHARSSTKISMMVLMNAGCCSMSDSVSASCNATDSSIIAVMVERTMDFVKTFCPLVIIPDCLIMSLRSLYYVCMISADREECEGQHGGASIHCSTDCHSW